MALDDVRKPDEYQNKTLHPNTQLPSIIVSAEVRHSPEFRALNNLTTANEGSVVIEDSQIANHRDFKVFEGGNKSLRAALDFNPEKPTLPQVTAYHIAARNLGLHKALLSSHIRRLGTFIPELATDPQYAKTKSDIDTITPQKENLITTWIFCTAIKTNLERWVEEHRRKIKPDQIPSLAHLLTTILSEVKWLQTAAGDENFYNKGRDTTLFSFTESFEKIAKTIHKPAFKNANFQVNSSELIAKPAAIRFTFTAHTKNGLTLKYSGVAKVTYDGFQISEITGENSHKLDSQIHRLLTGTTRQWEAVNMDEEYQALAGLLLPIQKVEQTAASQVSSPIRAPMPTPSPQPTPKASLWQRVASTFNTIKASVFSPAPKADDSSSLRRPSFWRTAALAGVMGILGLSGKETHKTVNTQNNNAAQSVITPTQVQARSTIIAPAATAAPTMASASASVHAGLSANKVDHASIQRGLDMALRTQAGQALIHGLYPGQNLDQSQLDYLGHTIAHNVRAGLPSIHTRTNKEVINITDAGRNGGNTRLFEVHLDDSSSSFVQIDLPTLTTVQQHSLEHRLSTPITPRVAPQAPVSTLDSAGSKLAVQSYTEAAPNIVGDALNKLLQADRLKQHEYLRAQENARRQEKRQELRRYFDELHAKAAERRKLQK